MTHKKDRTLKSFPFLRCSHFLFFLMTLLMSNGKKGHIQMSTISQMLMCLFTVKISIYTNSEMKNIIIIFTEAHFLYLTPNWSPLYRPQVDI